MLSTGTACTGASARKVSSNSTMTSEQTACTGGAAGEAEGNRDRIGLVGMASYSLPLCLEKVASPQSRRAVFCTGTAPCVKREGTGQESTD